MEKHIYLIRHCEAEGQDPDAPLTKNGMKQAEELAGFLSDRKVERVISSPYARAVETIRPFAENHRLEIELDDRLIERVLSTQHLPDWLDKLEATFHDLDLTYEGGESSHEAMKRIVEVVEEVEKGDVKNTVLVAHGGILSLLLHHYDKAFGFVQWKHLSNPDVFLLTISTAGYQYKRLWKK